MSNTAKKANWGDTRFVHIQDPSLKRRVTAAFRYNDEEQLVHFSVAQCSKKDTFCKRIGRTVSHGRLLGGASYTITYNQLGENRGFKAVTNAVVMRVLEELSED